MEPNCRVCGAASTKSSGSPSDHFFARAACESCASSAGPAAGRRHLQEEAAGLRSAGVAVQVLRQMRPQFGSGSCSCGRCCVHSRSAGCTRSQPSCCWAAGARSLQACRQRRWSPFCRSRMGPTSSRYLLVMAVAASIAALASSRKRSLDLWPVLPFDRPPGPDFAAALALCRRSLAHCLEAAGCSSSASSLLPPRRNRLPSAWAPASAES